MEWLESTGVRPRRARYQLALARRQRRLHFEKRQIIPCEHFLNNRNNRTAHGIFQFNLGVRNASKTNENRSVRTGQGELANRRHVPA
jgi:hypothetical protein